MSESPYRTSANLPPSDWEEEAPEGARTRFLRRRGSALLGAALLVPLLVLARLLFGGSPELGPVTWTVATALVIGAIAFWPSSIEVVSVGERELRWRDRLLGSRARIPIDRVVVRVLGDERRSALWVGDGRVNFRMTIGPRAAVDGLAGALRVAVDRARAAPPRESSGARR